MKLHDLKEAEHTLSERNHLMIVNRLWKEYDKGTLNLSLSVVYRILKKSKEYSPVNTRIDDMLIEHRLAWRKEL